MDHRKATVRRRVCVIGAGAAGLCAVRHLARDLDNFEPAVFEQFNCVGGTWVYNEKTGLDEYGYPIHSSMYQSLRTNLPIKLMNFPDYTTMGTGDDACGSHRDVLNYLQNYTAVFQLSQYIQFNTRVECVRPVVNETDWRQTTWNVRVKNIKTNLTKELDFDAIMVCNGHFFEPNVPNIPGIDSFPGDVSHSHNYRKWEKYAGKRVIILGAASSGIDIGIELSGHANHVYLSHNRDRLNSNLPNNMTQVAGVERVTGSGFVLRDGTIVTVDSFIYCTGYKYSFPFLDEKCNIRVDENYVIPLYKHLINIQHPSMSIIGIPTTVIPFALFHMQVQYHLALFKGRVTLPTTAKMLEDSKLKTPKKRHAHVLALKQFDYNDDLAVSGGFERLLPYYKNGYLAWNEARKADLLHYKNSKFLVAPDNRTVTIISSDVPILKSTTKTTKITTVQFNLSDEYMYK